VIFLNNERIGKLLDEFNTFGYTENGMRRITYTKEEKLAKEFFKKKSEELGMDVRFDSVGNVIARREGIDHSLPAIAVGSHIDTVYNGGKYDGLIGVIAGLEIIEMLEEEGIQTVHPIEVIAFTCEESSRFNFSTLGSKAMTGDLKQSDITQLKDRDNISLQEALKRQNLELENIHLAKREEKEIKAFFELHIEQGNKLIENNKTVGIVDGIAAPLRVSLTIEGKSAHSGTTSMEKRQDALLAAAELALEVEKAAVVERKQSTVATVGVMNVLPGAINIVPGLVNLKIDIRSTDVNSRNRVWKKVSDKVEQLEKHRNVKVVIEWKSEEVPVMMDKTIVHSLSELCENMNIEYMTMSSGAGHDSMNMAKNWPTGLIFIPSLDGLSHHPEEFTKLEDISTGIKLLKEVVLSYAMQCSKKEKKL